MKQTIEWIEACIFPNNDREVLIAVFATNPNRYYVTLGIYYTIGIHSGWAEEKVGNNCQVIFWAEKPRFPFLRINDETN